MAETGLYAFDEPEARKFADLIVVYHDMKLALELLMPIRDDFEYKVPGEIAFACWTAAVVRYARAFNSPLLDWPRAEAIESLSEGGAGAHQFFMDVRSGYVAHSVGAMDSPVPVVQIRTDNEGQHEIQCVSDAIAYVSRLSHDWIQDLRTLINEVQSFVQSAMKIECQRLLDIARQNGPEKYLAAGIWQSAINSSAPKVRRRYVGGGRRS